MKVLIDGRPTMSGVERYTRCLVRLLSEALDESELMVYGQKAGSDPSIRGARGPLRSLAGSARRILTDQLLLPLAARRGGADVIHSINYFAPRLSAVPTVVTCHDLSLINHFDTKPSGWMRSYERRALISGLQRAAHIITPSKTVAQRIEKRFGLDPKRITPIYPPVPEFPTPRMPVSLQPLAAQPYFLTVGTLEPRKNLERLLDAHQRAYSECRIPLYLAGAQGWKHEEVLRRIEGSQEEVRWLGYVDDAALAALYRKALAVVAFSLDEGFDYPTVEALSFGIPLVLSDIPVHREVIGEMGWYGSPNDAEALAKQMLCVAGLSDSERANYRRRALLRFEEIRAGGSVDRYLEGYRKALQD